MLRLGGAEFSWCYKLLFWSRAPKKDTFAYQAYRIEYCKQTNYLKLLCSNRMAADLYATSFQKFLYQWGKYINFIACRLSIQINSSVISICQPLSMLNISDLPLYLKVGYISLAYKLTQQRIAGTRSRSWLQKAHSLPCSPTCPLQSNVNQWMPHLLIFHDQLNKSTSCKFNVWLLRKPPPFLTGKLK